MQLKHFKKTFIMNNEWSRTCKALKGLLDILVCSKCHKNLHDPQQFLGCGHFLCVPCLNNNSTSCNECQLPSENKDTMKDIQRIAEACTIIANEIGYKYNNENLESRSQLLPVHKAENSTNTNIDPVPKIQQNKQNKRKGGTYLINNHSKRTKWDKPAPAFRIPKNIDKRNHVGETRLQIECKKGNIKNVEDLLKAGADPNVTCHAGWTALQESSDFHHYDIVKILLKFKADINKPGHEGRTALHEAVRNKDKEMVQLLLKHGAKKDIKDEKNNKPLDYCQSEEIKTLLDPNNEEVDKTIIIPELIEDDKSNIRPKSKIKNRVCEKHIIEINESIDKYPSGHVTGSRRITRHSICQDINKKDSRKKSITDYFPSVDQPSTSKISNNCFPGDSEKILGNESAINSSSSCNGLCEGDSKESVLESGISKNVQNSYKNNLTETLVNDNIARSQENFPQASTSKIVHNSIEVNHKNDRKSKSTFKLSIGNQNNEQRICLNNKDESDDSEIECIFEAKNGQAGGGIKSIKKEDNFKTDEIYVKTYEKCSSSQESIDVVNNSSCVDTEDTIIDIEN